MLGLEGHFKNATTGVRSMTSLAHAEIIQLYRNVHPYY